MKSHQKKKVYKAYCYSQAKKGLMNNASGEWRPVDSFAKDGMRDGYKAGYRLA